MRYEAPRSVAGAVELLAAAGANGRVLAGGTDLLVKLRAGLIDTGVVVDVKHIAEMRTVTPEAGGWRIGAAVTGAELGEHAALKRTWPGVVEAAELIGSTQIQGRATVGGNLCNASPAADTVPALIAAAAMVSVAGPGGRRDLAIADVVTGPGTTCLGAGDLAVSLFLPAPGPRSADAYLRFIPRTEMDIAVVGAGVSLTLDGDGRCGAARLGLGAVAERPLLVPAAGDAVVGTTLDAAALDDFAEAARAACRPIDDKRGTMAHRVEVAGVLARRAAQIAQARAGERS